MYLSDLILLIIVVGFFAYMLYKKRKKAKSADPEQSLPVHSAPLPNEYHAERASVRGVRELAVLSYYYDATRPPDDRSEVGVQPLDVIIEQDVNDLLADLTRKGYRPSLSYMSVVDRIFIFVAY